MNKTGIEYLDYTWNPLAMRCAPVSEGCEHCWHLRMANRLSYNPVIDEARRAAFADSHYSPYLDEKELESPLHVRKPGMWGVQFMGDLFHEEVQEESLWEIFATMAETPQHTFIILTKRPERMCKILNDIMF